MTLNDLRPDLWRCVAVSTIDAEGQSNWAWHLSPLDRKLFEHEVEARRMLKAQKRRPIDGRMLLMGKFNRDRRGRP